MGLDSRTTLWGSFLLRSPGRRTVFVAGDTGYGHHFKEIRKMCEEEGLHIDLALLPIGPHADWGRPDTCLSMTPEDAVQAHIDLKAAKSIATHHSTFEAPAIHIEKWKTTNTTANKQTFFYDVASHDLLSEARRRLGNALRSESIPDDEFRILEPGEFVATTPEG
eukprot:Selendium_serpulae@DN6370_c0_g1_i10.p7